MSRGEIHFLATPNPKPRHQGEPFVIAAHPHVDICAGPLGSRGRHWIYPLENAGTARPQVLDVGMERKRLLEALERASDDCLSQWALKCPLCIDRLFSTGTDFSPKIQEDIDVLKT